MKVPYSWLKDFVDIDVSAYELAEKLLSIGFEVEEIIDTRQNIQKVVIGHVDKIVPHENADKLRVCTLNMGDYTLQIITGAKNVQEGDTVPVATDGAVLAGGKIIRTGELRGLLSQGMLCSGEELGLTENDFDGAGVDGIWILPSDAPIGMDINDYLGLADYILDISVTANRPDCQSIIGIAREVAAVLNKKLKMPDLSYDVIDACGTVTVENLASDLCPRYMAREVRDAKIFKSPTYIRNRLRLVGLNSINNIVDITNYVLIEMGQPMHAFDKRDLVGDKIIVRRAKDGEEIKTFDGKNTVLDDSVLVICDAEKPCALAGIMGGENSGIKSDTNNIVFECAKFTRDNIRRNSRRLNVRSDSSARYEKGIDYLQDVALDRALNLICATGSGYITSNSVDVGLPKPEPRVIKTAENKISNILGIEITKDFIIDTLNSLCIDTEFTNGEYISKVPLWREDIETANDLAEEIIRFYGYDHITPTLFTGCEQTQGGRNLIQNEHEGVKRLMVGMGFYELCTYSFTTEKAFDLLTLDSTDSLRQCTKILNPLGEDWSVMRTLLSHSALTTVSLNQKRKNKFARLFEIAKVYRPKALPLVEQPVETDHLVIATYGADEDFFTLKGVIDNIMAYFGLSYELTRTCPNFVHSGRGASIIVDGINIGFFGEVHPVVFDNYELQSKTYIAELDFDKLQEIAKRSFSYVNTPKYPAIERDYAFVMKEDVAIGNVLDFIKGYNNLIINVNLFDIYRGAQVPEGHKSVALSIEFRAEDRTLKDNEVQEITDSLLSAIQDKFEAVLR